MTTILGKIRTLRTTSTAIESVALEEGRLAYLTDQNALVSGDGTTHGSGLLRIGALIYDTDPTLSANLDLNAFRIVTLANSGIGIGGTAAGNLSIALFGNAYSTGAINAGSLQKAYDSYSTCIGGWNCFASGNYSSTIGGYRNTTRAQYTFAYGRDAAALVTGESAHSAGGFGTGSAAAGTAQHSDYVLRQKTTDATLTNLNLNGTDEDIAIDSGYALFGTVKIVGIKSDGSAVNGYLRKFAAKNTSGTVELVGTVETVGTDIEDDADWGVDFGIFSDKLRVYASGEASATVRWVAHVDALKVKYGT